MADTCFALKTCVYFAVRSIAMDCCQYIVGSVPLSLAVNLTRQGHPGKNTLPTTAPPTMETKSPAHGLYSIMTNPVTSGDMCSLRCKVLLLLQFPENGPPLPLLQPRPRDATQHF